MQVGKYKRKFAKSINNEVKNKPTKQTDNYKLACDIRNSDRWKKCRSLAMSIVNGMCIYCYKVKADEVHHISPVAIYPELAYYLENLAPLCLTCHGFIETRNKRGDDTKKQIRLRFQRHFNVDDLYELKNKGN